MLAVSRGRMEMVEICLETGADINAQDEVSCIELFMTIRYPISECKGHLIVPLSLKHIFKRLHMSRKKPTRPELIPRFRCMKQLSLLLLPPGWDSSPSQGYL